VLAYIMSASEFCGQLDFDSRGSYSIIGLLMQGIQMMNITFEQRWTDCQTWLQNYAHNNV